MQMNMRRSAMLLAAGALGVAFFVTSAGVAAQAGKTLINDPLTGLPIPPSEDSLHLGNAPDVLPESAACKSKMQMDFYSPNGVKMNATAAWFESKLPGFKKANSWLNGRTHISFYKPDGTVLVSLTGNPAPQGQDADVHGIVYSKFTPPLSEKAIAGMSVQKFVCN